ncbi:hypothetical protein LCGC14_1915070 [marine sediment metagenome]|uniref:Uncharacterized protein n=1 Tax=marine sediment metagenome TaxID=412755 RepID=A0A0F9FSD6_9ZZZZ
MPMDFPDLKSLIQAAEIHDFRKINKEEWEDDFREALVDHVESRDYIESGEIRYKVGWDKWTEAQKKDSLIRKGFNLNY